MKKFNLPDLGEGLPDAEIVRWLVKEGDRVELDQPMVEMETAKAVVEVPSPLSGTITKLLGQAGDVSAVGATLVEFDGGDDDAAEPNAQAATAADAAPAQESPATAPATNTSGGDVFKLPDLGEGLPDAEIVRCFRWLMSV